MEAYTSILLIFLCVRGAIVTMNELGEMGMDLLSAFSLGDLW